MQEDLKHLLYIYLAFVLLKIFISIFIQAPMGFADSYLYVRIARSIFFEHSFFFDNVAYTLYPPGYSALISSAFLAPSMESVFFIIKLINSLVLASALFPLYFLAREFLTGKKALIASSLAVCIPSFLAFNVYPLSESLFYPLVLWFIFLLYRACLLNSTKYFSWAGLFLGVMMLVKFNAAALFVSSFILFIISLFKKEISFKNMILFYSLAGLALLPWFLRNLLHFGFSLNGLLGRYILEVPNAGGGAHSLSSIFIWLFLYLSYSILATGIFSLPVFFKGLLVIKEEKLKLFLTIVILAFLAFILLASVHSSWFEDWEDNRPSGRYLEQSFPLMLLGAFVLFDKNIQSGFTRKEIFLAILAALPAYFLLGFKLYPVNNMSLAFLGALSYMGKGMAMVFLLLLIGSFILVKKLNFKSFSYFLICFLLLGNLANFAMIYYSSQQDWLYREEAVMGRWIDANLDKDDVIGVPVEEHGFCKIGVSRSTSILYSGLYFKNKIVCIDGLSDYDYLLTANALNHTKLASFGETAIYGKLPLQAPFIE